MKIKTALLTLFYIGGMQACASSESQLQTTHASGLYETMLGPDFKKSEPTILSKKVYEGPVTRVTLSVDAKSILELIGEDAKGAQVKVYSNDASRTPKDVNIDRPDGGLDIFDPLANVVLVVEKYQDTPEYIVLKRESVQGKISLSEFFKGIALEAWRHEALSDRNTNKLRLRYWAANKPDKILLPATFAQDMKSLPLIVDEDLTDPTFEIITTSDGIVTNSSLEELRSWNQGVDVDFTEH